MATVIGHVKYEMEVIQFAKGYVFILLVFTNKQIKTIKSSVNHN